MPSASDPGPTEPPSDETDSSPINRCEFAFSIGARAPVLRSPAADGTGPDLVRHIAQRIPAFDNGNCSQRTQSPRPGASATALTCACTFTPSARPSCSHDFRVRRERRRAPSPSGPKATTATISLESTGFIETMRAGMHVEDRAWPRRLARKAHVARDDTNPATLSNSGGHRWNSEAAAANAERQETIVGIVPLDNANETHRGVARHRQRQRRVALQIRQRSRRQHPALLHQHDLIGEALDLRHVVRDIDDRQGQTVAQALEERQNFVLGRTIESADRGSSISKSFGCDIRARPIATR